MECPFELPVKKEMLPPNTQNVKLYRFVKLLYPYTEEEADYIVQAINSHEKLVEALRIYGHHCRTDDSTMCEHLKHSDYPCTCGFEQALKEAEKK